MTRLPLSLLPDSAIVQPDGSLAIGGCDVAELAAEFGTPLFIYDEAQMRARCREAVATFGLGNAVYATKAFLCTAMARLAYDEGMLLDVASGGELYVALRAGVPASALVMHGNNKSMSELRVAITQGAKLDPAREPGLEQKGASVGGSGLVDLHLMPGACVVEEAGRSIDG